MKMICQNCGNKADNNDVYCLKCGTRLNNIQENNKNTKMKRLNKELINVASFGIFMVLIGFVFVMHFIVYIGLGIITYDIYRYIKHSKSNSQTIHALNRSIPITLSAILFSIFGIFHIGYFIFNIISSNLQYILLNLFMGLIALSAAKFLWKSEKAGGIIGITYSILELIAMTIIMSTSNPQRTAIDETSISFFIVVIIVLIILIGLGWKSLNERDAKET